LGRLYESGAFAQQCFASHPLCLTVQPGAAPAVIVLACSSCHLLHRLQIHRLSARLSLAVSDPTEQGRSQDPAEAQLARCIEAHGSSLHVAAFETQGP
jgi:hypothetical protein